MRAFFTTITRLMPAIAALGIFCGCGKDDASIWQGYIDADTVYLSPESGGIITEECASRGDRIKKDAKLFELDKTEYSAAYYEADANLKKARAELQDLLKGAREEEINQIRSTISKLEAVSAFSDVEHERTRGLHGKDAIAGKEYDAAKWNAERDRWALNEAKRSLDVAMLPARKDRITAATEAVTAAENSLAAAKWRLEQRTVFSPGNARVFDVLMRKGEYAAPNSPVMSLIPDENMKVRFFVKYAEARNLKIGDKVEFTAEKNGRGHTAIINYISPKPEYTPPVIYSQENTSKLIFMIEAKPAPQDAPSLNPGLPVTVKAVK